MTNTQYQFERAAAYKAAFEELAALVSFSALSHESRKEKADKIEADLSAKLEKLRTA